MQGDQDKTNTIQMNQVFANCSEEDEIYPLTVKEIVEAQKANTKLKHFLIECPHPQSAGTTKLQRRVGTRKRPPPKKPELAIER